ncbi:hypothetical protein, partial [Shigella sonnei]
GGTADRNRSHWSTSKTPSYTKSVSWQHHQLLHKTIQTVWIYLLAIKMDLFFFLPGGGDV